MNLGIRIVIQTEAGTHATSQSVTSQSNLTYVGLAQPLNTILNVEIQTDIRLDKKAEIQTKHIRHPNQPKGSNPI